VLETPQIVTKALLYLTRAIEVTMHLPLSEQQKCGS